MFLLEFILMTIKNSYNSKILIMAGPFSIKWKVTITREKNKTLLDFSWEQQWLKNFPKEHFWEQVTILRASLVAQRRSSFDPWVGNIPWRRDCQPTLVFLPGEFHGQRSLADYSPWGCKGSDTTKQVIAPHRPQIKRFQNPTGHFACHPQGTTSALKCLIKRKCLLGASPGRQ